jgi:hypothetical protein
MSIKENASIKKNPVTSIIGLILIVIATGLFTIPYFYDLKQEVDSTKLLGMGAIGLLLVLAPDELLGIIKRKTE